MGPEGAPVNSLRTLRDSQIPDKGNMCPRRNSNCIPSLALTGNARKHHRTGMKHFHHPLVGDFELNYQAMHSDGPY